MSGRLKKQKTVSIVLEFDNYDAAHQFFAWWLDGGGDGGGDMDWDTSWSPLKAQVPTKMRIKGTGDMIFLDELEKESENNSP